MLRAAVTAAAAGVTVVVLAAAVKHVGAGHALLDGVFVAAVAGGASLAVQWMERRGRT